MKKINIHYYLLISCLVLVSACGDEEVLTGKIALLTAHEWKFSTCESEDEITVEFTNAFNAGARYTFLQNGTYSAKLGNVFNNVPYTGDWEFASNESQIILDKGTDEEIIYTIETLSSTTLGLSEPGYTLIYIK
jgi:hypothetical protein